ncbi:phosphoribosyl transferase domain protein [Acinetobacter baumannii 21072]|uniref:Phosphoribosyl transferase domain protein n=1 Tax=Acinetobacter baumannii 21072 TaxID=1310697 RepID=A0A062IGS3_ACIBA|nr:phosphoribosyl transferase domain protein [Acinetobacter baumannii 21072]
MLIIDDVITTGSSIHALSQALKQLGCTSIHASCLAAASSTSY